MGDRPHHGAARICAWWSAAPARLDDADDAIRCNQWVVDRHPPSATASPGCSPSLPLARIGVPPTQGKVWIVGEEDLMETINPDKPKTKLATSKIELIAGELERAKSAS